MRLCHRGIPATGRRKSPRGTFRDAREERYANRKGTTAPQHLVARLIDRYGDEKRPFRACEPRDLIERANDICRFRSKPLELTNEVLDLAWIGYFGNSDLGTRKDKSAQVNQ